MSLAPVQRSSSLPWAVRHFLLTVSVVFCLALSTGGVGGQTPDDHGDTIRTATNLPLGSSIKGRIDPGSDRDVFRLDLSGESGTTDVWIYATGELDTVGGLFNSQGNRLLLNDDSGIVGRFSNFHLRANLGPTIYYIGVFSYLDGVGDYTLYTEAVTDPRNNRIDTAARLSLDSPTPGSIDSALQADYFRLDFDEFTNLDLYARSTNRYAVDVVALDSGGSETSINVRPLRIRTSTGTYIHGSWIRDDFGRGTHYVKISAGPGVRSYPVPYTIHALEDVRYTQFINECEEDTRLLNDPLISDSLYACQWHLDNSNETDINVEPVWEEGIKGEGINVAVVDDGMYYAHKDLKDNVDTSKNHDYTGGGDIYIPFEHHGTRVAGLIAARDNEIGVRGVAPRATVYGYNFLVESTIRNMLDAMTRNRDVTAASNNSWGPTIGPGWDRAPTLWKRAIEAGINSGYDRKGVFYAFAAGNGHEEGDNANLDEIANFYGVTAVCAVNDHYTRSGYSEMGANLWVCAPSNDPSDLHRGILTTENSDRYYEDFSGTSASTPMVTGVAALVRSVNPDLTWRDVKLILAGSARKNDVHNSGWQDGARKYSAGSEEDRYHFNHEYGFGVVDAKAAVDLAKEWRNLPKMGSTGLESGRQDIVIPDAPRIGPPVTVSTALRLNTGIRFIEFVEVNVDFRHNSFRDLTIELESPSGAVSELSVPFDKRRGEGPMRVPLNGTFRFGSAKHLGEDPNGAWKLRVTDHVPFDRGTLQSWSIRVYGHESAPGAPTLDSVAAGVGTLTASWSAPVETGNGPVTAYDLRYIQTVDLESTVSGWTVMEGVWKAETGGSLEYVIPSLVGGVRYEVQVRAANRVGAGPWSNTLTGMPIQETSGECGTGGAVADPVNNPALVFDCNALVAARDSLAGSAALNWSANTPIADWQGVTVDGTPRRVTALSLPDAGLTGGLPMELSRLDGLKRLVLRENELTGPIPAWIGDLANLEDLSLWGNRLYGPLPTSLGNLVNLESLLLSRNPITGPIPAEMGNLANLKELRLFDSQMTGPIPTELSRLAALKVLQLSKNRLDGTLPAWLGGLADLEVISLWGNEFTGLIPHELGGLEKLEELRLAENALFGPIPASFGDLEDLRILTLRHNQLEGCVPGGLRDVDSNDLDHLGLPFCDVLLADLSISPGELVQSFDPYRTDYTALASAARMTVTAVNEQGATVRFFDRNDREIADADTSLDGHQVDLRAGITVVRVRLTSADGQSTNTYTVAVSRVPSAPIIDAVTSGEHQLAVSWSASDETGGSNIVAYDLRYAQTVDGEEEASVWTVVEDVWTAVGGGGLEHVITELTGSTKYDVQVRALNRTGPGPWSETATQTTATSDCVTGGALEEGTNTGLISDCETLLAARDTLEGAATLNWSPGTPIAEWDGVILDGTPQRVLELTLYNRGLDGTLPAELGKLTNLQILYLNNNDLSGAIPGELGEMFSLTHLFLHRNRLTGEIPGELSKLSDLEWLSLYANELSGDIPDELGDLLNLKRLYLNHNELSGEIPSELGRLTRLTHLFLHRNDLSGRIPLGLAAMTNLEWLSLYSNDLTGGIPRELADLSKLERLYLHANPLGGSIPPELGEMSSLTHLLLLRTELTGEIPAGLGQLETLEWLALYDNRLTGNIPSQLGDLAKLKRLYLHFNQLDGEIPKELGKLGQLTNLWLSQNNLSGEIPAEFGGLDNLVRWRLSGNRLTGCVPAGMAAVTDNDIAGLGLEVCP